MADMNVADVRFRRAFILLLLAFVLVVFVGMIRSFLTALLLAAIFAALLYPLQTRLCAALGGRPRLAASILLVAAVLLVGVPLASFIGLLTAEALHISKNAQVWVTEQIQSGQPLAMQLPDWLPFREEIAESEGELLARLGEAVGALGRVLLGTVPDITRVTLQVALDTFILLYAMFVFLSRGESILERGKRYLPLDMSTRDHIIQRGFTVARAALKGIFVVGVLQGVMIAIAFKVIGLPGAVFWGTIVVILSAIPALGAPLVWGPAAIYLLMTDQVGWGIALIIWGGLIVGSVDNILRPIVVGREAKIPDLLILIATLGGIGMFGAIGIILGPIVAAVVITSLDIYRAEFGSPSPPEDQGI